MNDTTRKFPRTLAEAFPDSPQPNFETNTMDKEDKIVITAAAIITVVIIVLGYLGVL